jgi:hypothetical protein
MPEKERNYKEGLAHVMNTLAESTLDLSDEEVEAEIREEGDDPKETADHIRKLLRKAVKEHQQRHLIEAQERYEARIAAMNDEESFLPASAEEQRDLFMSVMTNKPEVGTALLTAQHRDFKDLTEADIKSYLKQLKALGALDDLAKPEDEKR